MPEAAPRNLKQVYYLGVHFSRMQKEVELFIPENIDVDKLIPATVKGAARERYHDRIIYLLHTIVSRLNTKKVFESYLENGYVRLMKKYLLEIMESQADAIIDNLKFARIIEVDTSYEIGHYSMGYILTDRYLKVPLTKVTLISYQVIKTFRNIQGNHNTVQRKLSSHMQKAISQLSKPWHIDTDGAKEWISKFENKFYNRVNKSTYIPSEKKPDIIKKYTQYYQYIEHLAESINQGTTEWIIDPKANRLHTAFTSLPRPLKNFLTYDGSTLATVDIKNSQPLLFSWMTKARFWSTSQELEVKDRYKDEFTMARVGNDIHRQLMKNHKTARSTIITMVKNLESIDNSGPQRLNFLCLCETGTLYEFIMLHFNGKYIEGKIDRFGDRTLTKQEVMRIMYFDTRKEKAPFYAPFKRFAKHFPVEAQIMRLIKSCGYKEFPILLQRIESKLMLEKVAEKMPVGTPFLTIHDSLIIPATEEATTAATKLIQDQVMRYLTIRPRISDPEILTPDNAFKMLDSYVEEKLTKLELRFRAPKGATFDETDELGGNEL